MNRIKALLVKAYAACVRLYDKWTAEECEVSVGDIILRRAEFDHCQFLLTTRNLDVAACVYKNDKSFSYQNAVSRALYGDAHLENKGNREFV